MPVSDVHQKKSRFMTLDELNARDEAKALQRIEVQNRNHDDGGITKEEWDEQDRQIDKAIIEARARNIQTQKRTNQEHSSRISPATNNQRGLEANSVNNEQPNRGQRLLMLNDPITQPDLIEKDVECSLYNRVFLFGLIGASSTACVIALIAGLILGMLGALIGFCVGAFIGGLLGVVTARHIEDQTKLLQRQ